jgi:hypothetical protein
MQTRPVIGRLPDRGLVEGDRGVYAGRWVNACGKLPICTPLRVISSEYRPTWFAWVSIFSKTSRVLPSARPGKRVNVEEDVEERAEREGALGALQAVGGRGSYR